MISPLSLLLLSGALVQAAFLPSRASALPPAPTLKPSCYSGVYVVVARGTFEFLEGGGNASYGFQAPVVKAILAKIPHSQAVVVQYPENTDVSKSVPVGVADAQRLITNYHAVCPNNKIVLMGYSQGAIVSGSALAGGPAYVPIFGSTGAGPAALDRKIGDSSKLRLHSHFGRRIMYVQVLTPLTCNASEQSSLSFNSAT
jgi:hypothetical protein